MEEFLLASALIIANYFAGSISSAVLIARLVKKVDIRKVGYKTAGGSNVAENIGVKWGVIVALIDVCKGIPVLLFSKYLGVEDIQQQFIALAAIVGHCYPIWFRFAGGRGIGVLMGVSLVQYPTYALIGAGIFLISLPTWALKKYKGINIKVLSSPILTLVALAVINYLTIQSFDPYDEILATLSFLFIITRRVSARSYEYTNKKYNPLKLFLSRVLFDNSEVLK